MKSLFSFLILVSLFQFRMLVSTLLYSIRKAKKANAIYSEQYIPDNYVPDDYKPLIAGLIKKGAKTTTKTTAKAVTTPPKSTGTAPVVIAAADTVRKPDADAPIG